MNDVLVVIDMQNDFVSGSLGTKEAQAIVQNVVKRIETFNGDVVFTQDTHPSSYLQSQEGTFLPVQHCIKNTEGWELVEPIKKLITGQVYEKPTFGSLLLAESLKNVNERTPLRSITLIGLCTDICVVSNALLLKAFFPEVPIHVDAACCAGTTPENHKAALQVMRMCQIIIENE